MIRIFLIVLGAFLVLDTLFVMNISNFNLGVVMPGIIGLPLLILGIFFVPITQFFNASVFGMLIKWAAIIAYGLFTVLFITTTTLIFAAAHQAPPNNADVLIVLGAGLRGDRITLTLKNRLECAKDYLDKNPNTVCIVSGGKGDDEKVSEAHAMREYLIKAGVPDKRIIEESESKSTYENFLYSKKIIDSSFGSDARIAFISTGFHVFRAGLTGRTAGINAQGFASRGVWYITLNDYMRECAALTQYFLTGKL